MIGRLLVLSVVLGAVWVAPAQAATWCGTATTTNRVPELAGGSAVHVVYATPADGTDRLGLIANAMETDVESVDSWWRGQDPTRTPRFDRYAFPCGPQADIESVKLTAPSAQLTSGNAIFNEISNELFPLGLIGFGRASLVYFDGVVTDPHLCGEGSWYGNGAGLAVVFVGSCPGAHTEWAAAHELGHAFGAVADGAPHECPDSHHTCDDRQDLMYPYTYGDPLSASILDPGHDDYYGHSGTWTDIQDSQYLQHLDAQERLSVTITGAGRVFSDVTGVDCTASCATDWDAGTHVALTAAPGNGLRFVGWSGACTGDDCLLTLDSPKQATALFAPAAFRLTAAVTGKGTVRSSPSGIACKPRCRAGFESYTPVKLIAKPAKGWKLKAWSGACKGRKLTCSVPMKAAASARAVFVKRRTA